MEKRQRIFEPEISRPDPAKKLRSLLGPEKMFLLCELIEEIQSDSGYGRVEVVIRDRHVSHVDMVKQYR